MDEVSAVLRLFPGITAASARSFLSPPIKGVVLESFGAGQVLIWLDRHLVTNTCWIVMLHSGGT